MVEGKGGPAPSTVLWAPFACCGSCESHTHLKKKIKKSFLSTWWRLFSDASKLLFWSYFHNRKLLLPQTNNGLYKADLLYHSLSYFFFLLLMPLLYLISLSKQPPRWEAAPFFADLLKSHLLWLYLRWSYWRFIVCDPTLPENGLLFCIQHSSGC